MGLAILLWGIAITIGTLTVQHLGAGWRSLPPLWMAVAFGYYGTLYAAKTAGLTDDAAWRERTPLSGLTSLVGLPFVGCSWLLLLGRRTVTGEAAFDEMAPGVHLGALPFRWHRDRYRQAGISTAVNLCFEYPAPLGYPSELEVHYLPTLDSTPPEAERFAAAVDWAERQVRDGRGLLVHCAAGHGRSATLMIALLVRLGRFDSLEASREHVERSRRGIHVTRAQWRLLESWAG